MITSFSPRRSQEAPVAQGQVTWWRRGSYAGPPALAGPSESNDSKSKSSNAMLTCFWFEGSEDQILPAKTSVPVLELATALVESSSINAGWTLVQLQTDCWFHQQTGCMQCVAFHLAKPRGTYLLLPLPCLFAEEMPEKWDHSMLQTVCCSARQKTSSVLELKEDVFFSFSF